MTPEELGQVPTADMVKVYREYSLQDVYNYESHVKIGEKLDEEKRLPSTFMALAPGSWHPDVWDDINRMLTLNSEQSHRRQALHLCPLQIDICDRLITRYSNPGELVYDPFGGLMTVPLRALHLDRQGRGVELNTSYFLDGVKYLEAEEQRKAMPTLFDFEEES